jgi:hypothetical protein
MLEGQEDIQQDANSGESSDAPQTSSPEANTEVTASEQRETDTQSAQQKPFHEDPRIQEYIERQVARQASAYEERMEELQREMREQFQQRNQPKKVAHPLIEKFREIDPAYAEYLEGLESKASKVEQLEQRLSGMDQKEIVKEYENTLGRLHGENKVSPEMQDRIKERIDLAVTRNQKLGLRDIPNLYKEALEKETKFIDAIKRAERASYVTDKSKDARVPTSQPKGAPASGAGKKPVHTDREAALASIVKSALHRSKAESDI